MLSISKFVYKAGGGSSERLVDWKQVCRATYLAGKYSLRGEYTFTQHSLGHNLDTNTHRVLTVQFIVSNFYIGFGMNFKHNIHTQRIGTGFPHYNSSYLFILYSNDTILNKIPLYFHSA